MSRHVSIDPAVCSGKPVIRGTRIMVRNILSAFAGGASFDDVREMYPELTRFDIEGALHYTADLVDGLAHMDLEPFDPTPAPVE